MSDHDRGFPRWDPEPVGAPGAGFRDEGPASRWATLGSNLTADEVRAQIRQALAPRQPFAYGPVSRVTEDRHGFLLRFKSRGRVLLGEVEIAGWEGGTQVQVIVPAEQKRKDSEVLVSWIRRVLEGSVTSR